MAIQSGNCQDCGVFRKHLHKHHLKFKTEGGTDADGVVMICANCHEDRHGGIIGGSLRGRLSNSPEARAKRSASLKAWWSDPTNRARMSEKRKAMWRTRDRQKQSEVMKAIWTPEKRALHSEIVSRAQRESGQGWKGDPKTKLRLAIHMRHLWAQAKAEGRVIFRQLPPGKWSAKYDACVQCGTTKRKCQGDGLCTKCYLTRYHQQRKSAVWVPPTFEVLPLSA